ncbi:hypothetical protein KNE206_16660 [Kitasatospora sp. NE20-6]|uniref:cupin domain-containing protein n=1 Tax=Kitasatospora sp. NE20-6 TaxID=2859066 RepID=UPI0034DB9AC2
MPVVPTDRATVHTLHGASFVSYASAATGADRLRCWRVEIPAGVTGVEHTIDQEEVLHVLTGTPVVTLDGDTTALEAGDTVVAPAGTTLKIDNPGPDTAAAWATTTAGLRATLPDGTVVGPPWAQ